MTNPMGGDFISGRMGKGMKESGRKANSMERGLRCFLMGQCLMEIGSKVAQTE